MLPRNFGLRASLNLQTTELPTNRCMNFSRASSAGRSNTTERDLYWN